MKHLLVPFVAVFFLGVVSFGCQSHTPPPVLDIELSPNVEIMKRSVVVVYVSHSVVIDGRPCTLHRVGTGIVLAKVGKLSYVLTAEHVTHDVEDDELAVVERGYVAGIDNDQASQQHKGRIVYISAAKDLSLLEVDSDLPLTNVVKIKQTNLPAVTSTVFVVGFPNNTPAFVSKGVVARYLNSSSRGLIIDTTAPINQGNSGGPVFDDKGVMIGNILRATEDNYCMTSGDTSIEIVKWLKSVGFGHLVP